MRDLNKLGRYADHKGAKEGASTNLLESMTQGDAPTLEILLWKDVATPPHKS
jgi:hypothetical protein